MAAAPPSSLPSLKRKRPDTPTYSWSTLPNDISQLILSHLDLAAHARFSSVNKWYRSVAAEANTAMDKPLSLVVSKSPHRLIRRFIATFHFDSATFIGSFQGYLLLQLKAPVGESFIFNPASKSPPTRLPPIPNPNSSLKFGFLTVPVKAIILSKPSSGNCRIVVRDKLGRLSFCRLGDAFWNLFYDQGRASIIGDMIFFEDKLYVVDCKGVLKVFDSGLNSNPIVLKSPPFLYFVELNGKLLLVDLSFSDEAVVVFEFDVKNLRFVRLESIGDNILFVCGISCLSVLAKDYPQFRSNHIYVVPRRTHLYKFSPDLESSEFVCYSVAEKKVVEGDTRCPIFFKLFNVNGYQAEVVSNVIQQI